MGGSGQPGSLLQFLPFAMILAIFYFLILLPMKRRQKKIQEFQDGLKAGDKVVTTSGIYGQITKVNDKTVVSFAYEKRVPLFGPASLLIEYKGDSRSN